MATVITGPAQVQLVPVSEFAPGQVGLIRNQLVNALVTDIAKRIGLDGSKLIIRDIQAATDLDFTVEDWGEVTGATANVYEPWSTGITGNNRWLCIYGVKDDINCANVTALKFNIGGSDRVVWQLQNLNAEDGMVGICPSGIVIPENTPYTISRYVRNVSSPSRLVLKGVTIEPRGRTISP